MRLIYLLLISLFLVGCAREIINIEHLKPVIVADQKYYSGKEGNIGIIITGKFNSNAQMAETFNLLNEVGLFRCNKWRLYHILVSIVE